MISFQFHTAGLACPNLYFDVGAVTQSGGIKYLVEKIGSNRLYICSNTPECYLLPSLFLLESADLSDVDYDNVSQGTLNNIFKLSTSKELPFDKPHIKKFNDLIKRPKIDTHWHTGTWDIVEPMIDFAKLAETQKFGCKAIVTSSVLALNCDMERGNAETKILSILMIMLTGISLSIHLMLKAHLNNTKAFAKSEIYRLQNYSRFL